MDNGTLAVTGYHKFTKRRVIFLTVSFVILLVSLFASLNLGSLSFKFSDVWNSLLVPFGFSGGQLTDLVIWNTRLPRVLCAIVAGGSLALAGVVVQVSTRNPLASPFTLGVSSSAGFGAALAITLGAGTTVNETFGGFQVTDYYLVVLSSLFFSMLVTVLLLFMLKFKIARAGSIVLAGVALNFLFSAATSLLQYIGSTAQITSIVFWMFGSLSKVTWPSFWALCVTLVVAFILLYRCCWKFNGLYMGDEVAKSFGVDTHKIRLLSIALASVLTSLVVSFLGVIGFVCLVAPHMSRLVVGGDHRYLIPASCLTGANILLISDTVSRTVFLPLILPVGILTSFLGVPLFLYLLFRRKEFW